MTNEIDKEVGEVKALFGSLTDDIVESGNGNQLKVHHIDGERSNKLVIGSSGKGKSRFNEASPKKLNS